MSSEMTVVEFERREVYLSELDDGPPFTVHGVALGEGDVTVGSSGIKKLWPGEELKSAAETLQGKNLVVDHENSSHGVVGQITKAGYKEGVGIIYEAELHDEELAGKIENGLLEVSIRGQHIDVEEMEEDDETGAKVVEGIQFENLSIVPRGASPSNTLKMGSSETLNQAALAEFTSEISAYEVEEEELQEEDEDGEVEPADFVQWGENHGIVVMVDGDMAEVDLYEKDDDGTWRFAGETEEVSVGDLSQWDVDEDDIGAAESDDDEDEESDEEESDEEEENAPPEDFIFESEEEARNFIEGKDGLTGVHEMGDGQWMPGATHEEFEEWHQEQHESEENGPESIDDVAQEDLDKVYDAWDEHINMQAHELQRWSENPCSRSQPEMDTLIHSTLRLIEKGRDDWNLEDLRAAEQTIDFIEDMRNSQQKPEDPMSGNAGCPSDWATALLTFGHNPFNALPDPPEDEERLEAIELADERTEGEEFEVHSDGDFDERVKEISPERFPEGEDDPFDKDGKQDELRKHGMDPDVEDDRETEQVDPVSCALDLINKYLQTNGRNERDSVDKMLGWLFSSTDLPTIKIEAFRIASNAFLDSQGGVDSYDAVNIESFRDWLHTHAGQTPDGTNARRVNQSEGLEDSADEGDTSDVEEPSVQSQSELDGESRDGDSAELQDYSFHEPDWSGTTESEWSSPDMEDFDTDDLSDVANHFLISTSGFPPENFSDLKLPVVEPNGDLNLNALSAVKGGRGVSAVEGLSSDMEERIVDYVNNLANEHFDRNWGEEEAEAPDIDGVVKGEARTTQGRAETAKQRGQVLVLTGDDLRQRNKTEASETDSLTHNTVINMTDIEEELAELDEPVAVERDELDDLQEKADRFEDISENLDALRERTEILDDVDRSQVEELSEADEPEIVESARYESLQEEAEQVAEVYAAALAEEMSAFSTEELTEKFSITELREKYEEHIGAPEEELTAEPKSGDPSEEELEEGASEGDETEELSEQVEEKQAELRQKILNGE